VKAAAPSATGKEKPISRSKGGVPLMRQYREAKEKHPKSILLFRIGDFYEIFEEDAEICHKLLGLTLTTRGRDMKMVGFPHHQLEAYLQKLLKEGKQVAVCDQVNSEDGKRVGRDMTRAATKADEEHAEEANESGVKSKARTKHRQTRN
jgi:DNA mismatch repair protein MutS